MNVDMDLKKLPLDHVQNVAANCRDNVRFFRTYQPGAVSKADWPPERIQAAHDRYAEGLARAEAELEERRARIRDGVG